MASDKHDHPHGGPPGQTGQHPEHPHGGPPGQQPQPQPRQQQPGQQHGGETFDASGQPTSPAPGGGQQQPHTRDTPPAPPPRDEKAEAAAKEQRAYGSIGAQIILDYNGDGSLGARGGASADMVANQEARDAHLLALGLDPQAPSGPPPSMEVRKARQELAEATAKAQERIAAAHATPGSGAASRVSSLAAGLITEPADVPIEPPPDTMSGGRGH